MTQDRSLRRAMLGDFLRTRRERRTPEAAGLPGGPRRRTAGLRREEVAMLAQVSPTYYTYIEQGRDILPSAGVLAGVATALALDDTEVAYLRALLGEPPPPPVRSPESVQVIRDLVSGLEPAGLPVYAIDDDGDIVATTAELERWYGPLDCANFVSWFFGPQARCRLADWEADAGLLVKRIRFHLARRTPSGHLTQVLQDLHATDPDFARWWDAYDVSAQEPTTRRFHIDGAERTLRLVPLRPVLAQGFTVIVHLPPGTGSPNL